MISYKSPSYVSFYCSIAGVCKLIQQSESVVRRDPNDPS